MVTTLKHQNRGSAASERAPRARNGAGRVMTPEFRLLGLRPREARVDIIRQAMQEAAAQVKATSSEDAQAPEATEHAAEDDQQLARIATAGYHLLDPRRRHSLFERVQLLLWTEEDLDITVTNRWDAAHKVPAPRVKATPVSQPASALSAGQVDSPTAYNAEETQVALEVFRALRKQDRQATALWASVIGIALSLTLALTIFALIW